MGKTGQKDQARPSAASRAVFHALWLSAWLMLSVHSGAGQAEQAVSEPTPPASSEPAPNAKTAGTNCRPGESVFFSCRLRGGKRIVSLCATPAKGKEPFESIAYRYGEPAHIESAFEAGLVDKNRFYANRQTVSPRSVVAGVWFEQKGTRYLVTSCEGGDCPYRGGIMVWQGRRLAMSRACVAGSRAAYFPGRVLVKGDDAQRSHSTTELIQWRDEEIDIAALYPSHLVKGEAAATRHGAIP
jgi:hypothetical protein